MYVWGDSGDISRAERLNLPRGTPAVDLVPELILKYRGRLDSSSGCDEAGNGNNRVLCELPGV